MKLAVPAESVASERRVALVPDVVRRLVAGGWEVCVQSGAGAAAGYPDGSFAEAGAEVAADAASCLAGAHAVVRVQPPSPAEAATVPEGAVVVSFLHPSEAREALRVLADRRASVFSFDLVPRISRAQPMDALSSQATVAGYRAALVAATSTGRFFPMLMTAAGTVPPAKVLVMGAGVAGLQAIATARRLGAVVRAYDVRPAAKEEAESLGATFVTLGVQAEGAGGYARELSPEELEAQQRALADEVARADAVITTAAVPGRRAPVLVTMAMVEAMAAGSVVVDMAADEGGNCEATRAGEVVDVTGTSVVGMSAPASGLATHASALYARNVVNLLELLAPGGTLAPDFDDEIVAGTCVLRDGEALHPPAATPDRGRARPGGRETADGRDREDSPVTGIVEFLTVFVLAAFVGYEVISKVPSILHTPLMSGSNAIHGIVLVGALFVMGEASGAAQLTLGFIAVFLATLNVVGGFVVTDRMLEMFRAKPSEHPTAAERPTAGGDGT